MNGANTDATMLEQLRELLHPERLTHIVDIGASHLGEEPPYQVLLKHGMCRVVGFEPQPDALRELNKKKSPYETYLPYAIGNGEKKTLHVCHYPGWTSTLAPSAAALDVFTVYRENARVIGRLPIQTRRLDDVDEIGPMDLLKIDIQGGELEVFRNATKKLSHAIAIQTEVSFINMYENQPTLGDIDIELRRQGFVPQCFASIRSGMIAPLTV